MRTAAVLAVAAALAATGVVGGCAGRRFAARVPGEGFVAGWVRGPNGFGLEGVTVAAYPEGVRRSAPHAVARTTYLGGFHLDGLDRSAYLLVVRPPAPFAAPPPATATAGDSTVDIRVNATSPVVVTVFDDHDQPVRDVLVSLGPDGPSTWTSPDGRAVLAEADPGRSYPLRVVPPDDGGDVTLAPLGADAWRPWHETFRLAWQYSVRGFVRDEGGRPVTGAWVRMGYRTVQSLADGSYRFSEIPERDLRRVAAFYEPGAAWWEDWETASVSPGHLVADVVAQRSADLVVRVLRPVAGQTAYLMRGSDPRGRPVVAERVGAEGGLRFQGVSLDREFCLWIPPTGPDDDSSCFATGLRASEGPHVVERVRRPPIRVRVSGTGFENRTEVWAHAPAWETAKGARMADGTFEVRGLPDGTWTVTAATTALGAWKSTSARPGETVDLVLP